MDERMPRDGDRGLRLASFDGGGARVLSQLKILCNLMHVIGQREGREDIRPATYFDLIGGSDAGGFVVLFLIVFDMTALEALQCFRALCTQVYTNDISSSAEREAALRAFFEDLLLKHHKAIDHPLLNERDVDGQCQGFILAVPAGSLGSVSTFRTYMAPHFYQANITVLDAARVTCAGYPLFPSATITPNNLTDLTQTRSFISASLGHPNPLPQLLQEAQERFTPERFVSVIASFGSGHPGIISLDPDYHKPPGFFGRGDAVRSEIRERLLANCEMTAQQMANRMGHSGVLYRFSVDQGMQGMSDLIVNDAQLDKMSAMVDTYLEQVDVRGNLQKLAAALVKPEGMTTLESINKVPGPVEFDRGLPVLTGYFVRRDEPYCLLLNEMLEGYPTMRVIVVSGFAGAGKTWLTTQFAQENVDSFDEVYFIDGKSERTIKQDLEFHARAKGKVQASWKEALNFFGEKKKKILLFYDNVDSVDLNLQELLPRPGKARGLIIITSRNKMRGAEAHLHIELDMMTPNEAIQMIMGVTRWADTEENRQSARAIGEALGYLPVALNQAARYIARTKCSGAEYLELYRVHRLDILEGSVTAHQRGAFASFDVMWEIVPQHVRNLICILSFLHHNDFPMTIISLAASKQFEVQTQDFVRRNRDFTKSISLLRSIFCKDGPWTDRSLGRIVEAIQNHSLVSFSESRHSLMLRIHPLLHEWARLRTPSSDQALYREAATRLVACAVESEALRPYLMTHADSLLCGSSIALMHVNDRAAFASLFQAAGQHERAQRVWINVREELITTLGRLHLHVATVSVELATTLQPDDVQREIVESSVVEIYSEKLGLSHIKTLGAKVQLAKSLQVLGKRTRAKQILQDTLKKFERLATRPKLVILQAKCILAKIFLQEEAFTRALVYAREASAGLEAELGQSHNDTLDALQHLGLVHFKLEQYEEARAVNQRVVERGRATLGPSHKIVLEAILLLAEIYATLKKWIDMEKILEEGLPHIMEVYGDTHDLSITAMGHLANAYDKRKRFNNALEMKSQIITLLEKNRGKNNDQTLEAMLSLASGHERRHQPKEANEILQRIIEIETSRGKLPSVDVYRLLSRVAFQYYRGFNGQKMARNLQLQVVDGLEKHYGRHHPCTAGELVDLALFLCETGDRDAAIELAKEALSVLPEEGDDARIARKRALTIIDTASTSLGGALTLKYWKEVWDDVSEPFAEELQLAKTKLQHSGMLPSWSMTRAESDDVGTIEMALIKGVSSACAFLRGNPSG